MRHRFTQQVPEGGVAIGAVDLNIRTRHQLVPLLKGLQYIFVTEGLNELVFEALELCILGDKKKTGRLGMSLWEIFVLSSIRQGLNIDYDFLTDQANQHKLVRQILGVYSAPSSDGKEYHVQTVKDNVRLLSEEQLRSINDLVVKSTHGLIKKKKDWTPILYGQKEIAL